MKFLYLMLAFIANRKKSLEKTKHHSYVKAMSHTQNYIDSLQREYRINSALEHSYRTPIKTYIETLRPHLQALNDPKRIKNIGAPDIVVYKDRKGEQIPFGYIETKDINVNLDKAEKSEQMERYLKLDNLILTNYLEFRFYLYGEKVATITIGEVDDFFTQTYSIKGLSENYARLESLLNDFCDFEGQTITSPEDLAEAMAKKANLMRHVFYETLLDAQPSSLKEQLADFQNMLVRDMNEEQFADVYAQTIAYGLFTARLHDTTLHDFSRAEARDLVPETNPFLRKLFDYVCGADLEKRVVWIVDSLCEIFLATNMRDILKGFGKNTSSEDAIIHFYETFLNKYDPTTRKNRGVWYTPQPIVNFIVRAIDEVLQTYFGLKAGIADSSKVKITTEDGTSEMVHRVQMLDVATGTGTFTAEAIRQIHAKMQHNMGMWNSYVEADLLPRLHGFEILMASYAMCHVKVDLLLEELGYRRDKNQTPQRLHVYLTNALEEHKPPQQGSFFTRALANEANEANRIKRDLPIMVAYGNPPYNGVSANKGKSTQWLTDKLEDYKYVDGVHFGERKHWLQDDYVKFIRLAENYVAKNGEGVLAYITNHGYIDNVTFRGMRWHLLNTFDDIYIIDLHGNANKNEISPDGTPDKNVFDIQQGVSIIIAIKHNQRKEKLAQVHHHELWGKRESKYQFLRENSLKTVPWQKLENNAPNYFFVPKNDTGQTEYHQGFAINELMQVNSTGIVTMGDEFIIQKTEHKLKENIEYLLKNSVSEYELKSKFNLGKNYAGWVLDNKKNIKINNDNFVKIAYRPFDDRWTYFDNKLIWRWREKVMQHFVGKDNVGLVFRRQQIGCNPAYYFIANSIIADGFVRSDNKGGETIAPLYLYDEIKKGADDDLFSEIAPPLRGSSQGASRGVGGKKTHSSNLGDALVSPAAQREGSNYSLRKHNFHPEIIKQISKKLRLKFVADHELPSDDKSFNPLNLLDYIYAMLHSPHYRNTYKEFLKIDFPRIPYPHDAQKFWQLVKLGGELRRLHLMEHDGLDEIMVGYPESGDNMIEKVEYAQGKVFINKTQHFNNVSEIAWNLTIGGYQPAQKWLKDRKGEVLTYDDIKHYGRIIIALAKTHELMQQIDEVIQ